MITMILAGLWHGNTWNFVIWGTLHGLLLTLEKAIFSILKIKNGGIIGYILTTALLLLTWAFFRAQSSSNALYIFKKLIFFDFKIPYLADVYYTASAIIGITIGLAFDVYLYRSNKPLETIGHTYGSLKLGVIISFMIVLMTLLYSTSKIFVYFQF